MAEVVFTPGSFISQGFALPRQGWTAVALSHSRAFPWSWFSLLLWFICSLSHSARVLPFDFPDSNNLMQILIQIMALTTLNNTVSYTVKGFQFTRYLRYNYKLPMCRWEKMRPRWSWCFGENYLSQRSFSNGGVSGTVIDHWVGEHWHHWEHCLPSLHFYIVLYFFIYAYISCFAHKGIWSSFQT